MSKIYGILLFAAVVLTGCTREYSCDVGANASTDPQNPDDTTPPDSIIVMFTEVYTGDASYTEGDAEEECEAASNTAVDDDILHKILYCQCERSN